MVSLIPSGGRWMNRSRNEARFGLRGVLELAQTAYMM